jgi:uncharacterized protein (DUF433 family)
MIEDIIGMYENGWNVEDISDELGVDECYILEILEEEELI